MGNAVKKEELLLPRILCVVLVALMGGEIPSSFIFASLLFLGYSIVRVLRGQAELAKWLLAILAPTAGLAVYISMDTLIGKEPSGALLAVLAGLKALESKDDADERTLALIGLFLVCVVFLFRGDLWMGLFGTAATLGFLYLLFRKVDAPLDRAGAWRWTWKLTLRSLPLTLILFLVVPRLQHQWIWKFGTVANSGFREEVSPILVDRIQEDDTPVLRALGVSGDPAKPIYWRGSALEEVKGFSWTLARKVAATEPPEPVASTDGLDRVDYLLEPRAGSWSFAPEGTRRIVDSEAGSPLRFDRDRSSWRWDFASQQRKRLTAWIDPRDSLKGRSDPRLLETPRLTGEAERFVAAALPNQQRLSNSEKALLLQQEFGKEGFVYTRAPGRIPDLGGFLKAKKGYCEHYASALAILLRKAGVPARVVVGYLGGRKNPVGGFTLVTESDAHAWTEYLDENGRWSTADATAFVPPLDPQTDRRLPAGPAVWDEASWLDRARWSLEALNYQFTLFFMNFDLQTQKEIWEKIRDGGKASAALLLIGVLAVLIFAGRLLRKPGFAAEPAEVRAYRRLLDQAEKNGIPIPLSASPGEIAAVLQASWPDRAREIADTVQSYVRRRFAKPG